MSNQTEPAACGHGLTVLGALFSSLAALVFHLVFIGRAFFEVSHVTTAIGPELSRAGNSSRHHRVLDDDTSQFEDA